jgi:hypothetical protein
MLIKKMMTKLSTETGKGEPASSAASEREGKIREPARGKKKSFREAGQNHKMLMKMMTKLSTKNWKG